ncbi:MAG: hypothetical protein PF487_11845 [Bacteroidales bacterium]|jgi:hypothetical protein|nr:hypothetical protein [Bacteroidales bacterium]
MNQLLESSINPKELEGYSSIPDLTCFNKESNSVFVQSINFDNKKIVDINYDFKVMEVISTLLKEMSSLKEKVNLLDKNFNGNNNVLLAQGTLKSMWEEDDAWNEL